MKKIVIIGSEGMAGHVILAYFRENTNYEVLGLGKVKSNFVNITIDIFDYKELEKYIEKEKPDIVINCSGILIQKASEDISSAIFINSFIPHFLAKLGKKNNFKLINFTTDCVFSGKKGAYDEQSIADADSNYARTKFLGEVNNDIDLLIRTSFVGPELKKEGTGLLDWFLKQNDEIAGYTKAFWSGVTTLELAKVVKSMIEQNITGLYHLCPRSKISKFDLLNLFNDIFNRNLTIKANDDYSVDKSLLSTRSDFKYRELDYRIMIEELKDWMLKHKDLYNNYES